MTRLHLPSLQAAAEVALATPKEKYPLRLVHIRPGRCGLGQRYQAVANGFAAIEVEHPCVVDGPTGVGVHGSGSYGGGEMTIADTELARDKTILLWAPSVPMRAPTKAKLKEGAWIDLAEPGLIYWTVKTGAREIRLRHDGPALPGDVGTTHLTDIPDLTQIMREFIPENLHAGSGSRIDGRLLAVLLRAADLLSRSSICENGIVGDTPGIEIFESVRHEGASVIVDLTSQRRSTEPAREATAWAVIMPIQRRDGGRGIQPTNEPTKTNEPKD